MKTSLIIGAGQLGSRHLQGLLRLSGEQAIFVLDPSQDSLNIAQDRAKEISNSHRVHYITDWENSPKSLDLVIIATGSGVRAAIVNRLLENYKVNYLILEKVLFQDLDSYEKVGSLIASTGTPTWVNHPRRMFSHYHEIRNVIARANEPVVFTVVGSNWGLACNALHFIDVFAYLSGLDVSDISMDWVDPVIHESKRANHIELTGTLTGSLGSGNHFMITSFEGSIPDLSLYISSYSNRWIIHESLGKISYMNKENNFEKKVTTFSPEYQSTLTTTMAESLFNSGECSLPTYRQACASHVPFINAALNKYIELSGKQTTFCPIT